MSCGDEVRETDETCFSFALSGAEVRGVCVCGDESVDRVCRVVLTSHNIASKVTCTLSIRQLPRCLRHIHPFYWAEAPWAVMRIWTYQLAGRGARPRGGPSRP